MAINSGEFSRSSAMGALLSKGPSQLSDIGSIIGDSHLRMRPTEVSSEYANKTTSQILDPEMNLARLGYNRTEPIDWTKAPLPKKKDLSVMLINRISQKKNADCKVLIGKEVFNCHLLVMQCYSELFDGYVAIKKVEIPEDKCSPAAFAFIYQWMIHGEESRHELTRENVLDVFISAKYLKIKDLIEQCWAVIDSTEMFNEDTAFLLYVEAKHRNIDDVRQLMIPRIKEFFLMLVSSQDWLELDVEDVKLLLTSNYILINTEMEVFMSAIRWLKHDWKNRGQHKYEVISCVRFGNISPWQLIDIKRNPENTDFVELLNDPAICKLLDDGLAFVIVKHWYGPGNNDFAHWNQVLDLEMPTPRNFTGNDRLYFTYAEFLIYLDKYRRSQLKKTLGSHSNLAIDNLTTSSLEDFIKGRRGNSSLKL